MIRQHYSIFQIFQDFLCKVILPLDHHRPEWAPHGHSTVPLQLQPLGHRPGHPEHRIRSIHYCWSESLGLHHGSHQVQTVHQCPPCLCGHRLCCGHISGEFKEKEKASKKLTLKVGCWCSLQGSPFPPRWPELWGRAWPSLQLEWHFISGCGEQRWRSEHWTNVGPWEDCLALCHCRSLVHHLQLWIPHSW